MITELRKPDDHTTHAQRAALIPPLDRDSPAGAVRVGDVVAHYGRLCIVLVSHRGPGRPDRICSQLSPGRAGELAASTRAGIYDQIRPVPIVASGNGAYGWLVEPDLAWNGHVVLGPDPLCGSIRARLIRGEGARFRMGERDVTYVVGRYLGPVSMRHAPLLEYGHAWAGATWIAYEHNGSWTHVPLPRPTKRRARLARIGHWLRRIIHERTPGRTTGPSADGAPSSSTTPTAPPSTRDNSTKEGNRT